MRHLILILLVTILTQTALAQYQSGKVIYKVTLPKTLIEFKDTTNLKSEVAKRAYVRIFNYLHTSESFLTQAIEFNKKEALARAPITMEIDNNHDYNTAAAFSKINIDYYTNSIQNYQLHKFELAGRNWLIKDESVNYVWQITHETKRILGYMCYKATTKVKVNGKNTEEELEAWFAPDIPFQFGPIDIYGLPGLILEVNRKNFIYYATEINLNKLEKTIHKPKGKPISYEEFSLKTKKMRDTFN